MGFKRFLNLSVFLFLVGTSSAVQTRDSCILDGECADEFETCFDSLTTTQIVHYLLPTDLWELEVMCHGYWMVVNCPEFWSYNCTSMAIVDDTPRNWTVVTEFHQGFCQGKESNEILVDVMCYIVTRRTSTSLRCRTNLRGIVDGNAKFRDYFEYCTEDSKAFRKCLKRAGKRECPGKPRPLFIINHLPIRFNFQCGDSCQFYEKRSGGRSTTSTHSIVNTFVLSLLLLFLWV